MVDTRDYPATRAASWGAIFGGAVTALAVFFLFSLLGAALGLGMVDANAANPFAGAGTTFGLSSAVTVLVGLAAGGFVAGRLAGQTGVTHGFLTWAVTLLVALVLGAMAVSGAARLTVSTAGAVASAAGGTAAALGEAAGDAAGAVTGALGDAIAEVDFGAARERIRTALQNADIEALAPDRLQAEFEGAREDIADALAALRADPMGFEAIASGLVADLGARAEAVVEDIDREDLVAALMETGMTRFEAERAADQALAAYGEVRETVETQLAAAGEAVAEARQALAALEAEARRQAEEAAAAAAQASLWAFFAALAGAAISGFAGLVGVRTRHRFVFA